MFKFILLLSFVLVITSISLLPETDASLKRENDSAKLATTLKRFGIIHTPHPPALQRNEEKRSSWGPVLSITISQHSVLVVWVFFHFHHWGQEPLLSFIHPSFPLLLSLHLHRFLEVCGLFLATSVVSTPN